ncbi:esterase-like activity of phytase family protein [Rhizorhabdus dicambivorans]|nr:esterase-like activity of phytase family protein [Rhizorhabdus dicambivorans]
MRSIRQILLACTAISAAGGAHAQSASFTTPHITNAAGSESATLGGVTFVNRGITGAGRLSATTLDFRGETLGSFSGMAIDLSSWRRNADGSYSGSIFTLPDRGPFDGAIDYRNRVHTSAITFRPLAGGSAALPQAASSQSQVTITPTGGFTLKDALGVEMTGRDPGASTVTRGGIVYPIATDGTAAGHISLDAEAIAFRPDGSFYVSDEYADGIYYFDATGKQIGAIQTVAAMLPRTGGAINFNSTTPGQTGRRNNQGLEAMALTPDNRKLVTIQQSATVQDTNGANQQTRNNTRILVYDISGNAAPANPIGHYVLQLPIFNNNGSGGAPDRTAAQSEMLALNDTQFLVLARDGIGRGVAANASTSTTPMFKSILLVDTSGATNLAGTAYETGVTPIASNGGLVAGITPVRQVELVNMLNPVQLGRVGMNLTRLPLSNPTTISEKIEALALAPVLEEGAPQDFFLFVGNDNDFQGTSVTFNGVTSASGALDGSGNNDNVLLVYRLTLPTYVDPQALSSMIATAPLAINATRSAAADIGLTATRAGLNALQGARQIGETGMGKGVRIWIDGGYARVNSAELGGGDLNADGYAMNGGIDAAIGPVRVGLLISYRNLDGGFGAGNRLEARGTSVGGYAGIGLANGLYVQGAVSKAVDLQIRNVARDSAYGLTGGGNPDGDAWSIGGEIGWQAAFDRLRVGPFAGYDYVDAEIDGYTETGASLGNVAYGKVRYKRLTGYAGLEAKLMASPAFVPAIRISYAREDERGDRAATVRLASAQHAMGTQAFALPDTARDYVGAALSFTGALGDQIFWQAGGENRFIRGEDELKVRAALGFRF